jgi:RHS repeat-associated protein
MVNYTDYYPFGSPMPGRVFSAGDYRYGFNGMEKDDEVKGSGNHYTTFWRQYDPRLGRWMSPDPLMKKFAAWSPYNFEFNNPINLIDIYGNGPGDGKGKERAKTAKTTASTDTRTYDQVNGDDSKGNQTVDCSEFCREIAEGQGYDPGRDSRSQAAYYQKNGEYSTDVKDAKVGDFVFWGNNGSISHTGIITEISEDGTITVISAEKAGATKGDNGDGGVYQGGSKSLNSRDLASDGTIWQKRNGTGGTSFIGVGRPKLTKSDASTVQAESQSQDVHQEAKVIVPNATTGTNTTAGTPAAAKPATSSSSSVSSWWSGVKSDWNQFWSDFYREVNNPNNWTGQ